MKCPKKNKMCTDPKALELVTAKWKSRSAQEYPCSASSRAIIYYYRCQADYLNDLLTVINYRKVAILITYDRHVKSDLFYTCLKESVNLNYVTSSLLWLTVTEQEIWPPWRDKISLRDLASRFFCESAGGENRLILTCLSGLRVAWEVARYLWVTGKKWTKINWQVSSNDFWTRREFQPNVSRDDKYLGCVRLTLFRNKNTWSDDLKRYVCLFKISF